MTRLRFSFSCQISIFHRLSPQAQEDAWLRNVMNVFTTNYREKQHIALGHIFRFFDRRFKNWLFCRGKHLHLALCLQPPPKTATTVGPGEVWERLPSVTSQMDAYFFLTFDVNVGAVLLDVVTRPHPHGVNTLVLLVRCPHCDGGVAAEGLQFHGARRKQLDAWGTETETSGETNYDLCLTWRLSLLVPTISEPADLLLRGWHSRVEGALQG